MKIKTNINFDRSLQEINDDELINFNPEIKTSVKIKHINLKEIKNKKVNNGDVSTKLF